MTTLNPEQETTPTSPQPQQPQQQQLSIKDLLQSIANQPVDLDNLDLDAIEEQGNILTQKAFFLLGLAQELEKEPDNDNTTTTTTTTPPTPPTTANSPEDPNRKPDSKLIELSPEQRQTKDLIELLQNDAKTLMGYAVALKTNAKNNITTDTETMSKIQSFQDQMNQYDQYADQLTIRTKGLIKDTIDSQECDELLHAGKAVLQVWIDKRNFLLSKAISGNEDLLEELDNKLGDLINHPDDLIELIDDLRVNAVIFLNNVERHKKTILKAANDINDVLDEKDDTGKSLKDDEEVMYLIRKVKSKIGNAVDEGKSIDQDAAASDINDTAQKILDQIEEHDIVKKALARGTQILEQNKDDFDPEKLFDSNNSASLDDFLNVIKNEALSFLMEYLPSIKIPPLEHDDDTCTYSLHNIDLSKFHLLSENVDVELIENGVFVSATQISCEMDNLAFKYKSKSFPYPGATGVAYAKATGVSVALELRLEVTEIEVVVGEDGKKNTITVEIVPDVEGESENANKYEKKQLTISPVSTPVVTPVATPVATPVSTSPVSTVMVTPEQDKSPSSSTTQKLLSKLNSKLDKQYKLVLFHHPQHGVIKIGELQMELRDFFLKSLANFLLSLFKTQVQSYIQRTLNNVILQQSEKLLTSINRQVTKYLPVIAKILKRVEQRAPSIENIVINAAKSIQNDVKSDRQKSATPQIQPKLEIPAMEKLSLKNEQVAGEKKKDGLVEESKTGSK